MIGLAVLATGLAAGLAVGLATGGPDLVPGWPRRPRLVARGMPSGRAGGDVAPGRLWAGSVALGLVALALLWSLTHVPVVCVVPAAAVGALPHLVLARRRTRRVRRIQEAWPDGLRELRAAISAGLSLHGALVALARDGPPTCVRPSSTSRPWRRSPGSSLRWRPSARRSPTRPRTGSWRC